MNDPQSHALASLVSLFETDLARVSFPDVSAASLRAAAEAVEERRKEVLAAEAALRATRDALDESRLAFERLGRRALAYARIYADGDDGVAAQLGAIARALESVKPESAVAEPAKKRGRPRKSDTGLFEVEAASERGADSEDLALAESA